MPVMHSDSHPDIDTSSTARDKTHPFEIIPRKPKHRRRVKWLMGILILVLIVEVVMLINKHRDETAMLDRLRVQLKISEIQALEAEVRRKQQQLWDRTLILKENKGIDVSGWDLLHPTPQQNAILKEAALSGDGDAVFILDGMALLDVLSQRVADLAAPLGPPHIVIAGDSHFKLAYHFLTDKQKMGHEEARRILADINLQDPLIPGFFVWNFWFEDGLSTFVTRGNAPVTPEEAEHQALNSVKAEKERALTKLNSLRYMVGNMADLQRRGILAGGLFKKTRLGKVRSRDYRMAIDLRKRLTITIHRRSVKLEKISSLVIFPEGFKKDQDYRLQISNKGRQVRVDILNPNRFKNREIVIAVE